MAQKEAVTDYRTWVSGVTPQHVRGAPSMEEVQKQVCVRLGCVAIIAVMMPAGAPCAGSPRVLCEKHAGFTRTTGVAVVRASAT